MRTFLQKLGTSFMLPVSILPVISILFGIGFSLDYQGAGENSFIAAILIRAGLAIIDNIPLLFAVGIPVGLAKERDGSAALSGLAGYLVLRELLTVESVALFQGLQVWEVHPAFLRSDNVFMGILTGILAARLFDRFSRTELPSALAFFSGRRLVPILTVLLSVVLAGILFLVWPVLFQALAYLGVAIKDLGALGAGIYGFLNKLLIPTGLHHALNAVFWFDTVGINDLGNFWAGTGVKGVTGRYMAGYFPIMMFGLPGAALAMFHTARKENRKMAGSMLLAGSIASFVTGLTEPLEFLFMFLSPFLYFIHALLTGLSMGISALFGWTAGFNFSAGLIDFLFSSRTPLASKPWMLMVQGLFFFVLYYGLFRFFIEKLDLKTPGRGAAEVERPAAAAGSVPDETGAGAYDEMAGQIYEGLGGAGNLLSIDHCATRLRVQVRDSSVIDRDKIMDSGITSVLINGRENAQVIVGAKVQFVADAIKELDAAARGRDV